MSVRRKMDHDHGHRVAVRSPAVALALQRGPQIETVSVTGTQQDPALGKRSVG